MTREVSRRNSGDKGGIRPDIVGRRDLDPNIVEDRIDLNVAKRMPDLPEAMENPDV